MSLKGGAPSVDRSHQLNAYNSTWDSPDNGGMVTWTNAYWTGTYTFPVPSTIPAGGVTFEETIKAESRKNEYDYDTNFAPAMSVSGSMVVGGTVAVSAHSDSGTKPTDTQSKPVTLNPVSAESVVTVGIQDGPVYTYTFTPDPEPAGTPTATPTPAPPPGPASTTKPECISAFAAGLGPPTWAHAAAINEVRVANVSGDVAFHRAGGPDEEWCVARKDDVLKQGDEISCGPDGYVVLQFADNSTVLVKNTTQLKIASFFTEGGVVKTEILLRMGEVAAKVNKSEATKSDFVLKTNYHQGSVRGTDFSAFADPGSGMSVWSVRDGSVAVSNGKGGQKLLTPGQEAVVSKAGRFTLGRLGKAGAVGGATAKQARDRVLRVVARAGVPCAVTTPRVNGTSIRATGRDWKVSVKVIGKLKGTSAWRVHGKRVTALNALARRLRKRCR